MGDIGYMNTYTDLCDKHFGETAFILGAGPSLYSAMQESVFNRLCEQGIIITVNSGVVAFPKFDYWVSTDSLCRNWSWWDLVKNGKGQKVVRDSWLRYKKELKDFLYFKARPTSEDIVNPDDVGLCYCNSFSASIDLAIQMGCLNIFLLGLDHKSLDSKNHFWQFFNNKKQPRQIKPAQGPWKQQQSVFPIHLKAYKALEKFSKHKNCKIYNCNPDSDVKVFEKIKFKKVLSYL
jgi:hypothetical protein